MSLSYPWTKASLGRSRNHVSLAPDSKHPHDVPQGRIRYSSHCMWMRPQPQPTPSILPFAFPCPPCQPILGLTAPSSLMMKALLLPKQSVPCFLSVRPFSFTSPSSAQVLHARPFTSTSFIAVDLRGLRCLSQTMSPTRKSRETITNSRFLQVYRDLLDTLSFHCIYLRLNRCMTLLGRKLNNRWAFLGFPKSLAFLDAPCSISPTCTPVYSRIIVVSLLVVSLHLLSFVMCHPRLCSRYSNQI